MAKLSDPDSSIIFPAGSLLVLVNEKTSELVSVTTITSPAGIILAGDVHDNTDSSAPNLKVLLLNDLSVKYIFVFSGISIMATKENQSGSI